MRQQRQKSIRIIYLLLSLQWIRRKYFIDVFSIRKFTLRSSPRSPSGVPWIRQRWRVWPEIKKENIKWKFTSDIADTVLMISEIALTITQIWKVLLYTGIFGYLIMKRRVSITKLMRISRPQGIHISFTNAWAYFRGTTFVTFEIIVDPFDPNHRPNY